MHETGELENASLALSWHRVAAEAGNIWSMRDYAQALLRGEGVHLDQPAAITWLERSAAGGNPWAQRDLGCIYLRGDVAAADAPRAARYLALASLSDDEDAVAAASELFARVSGRDRVAATQSLLGELGYAAGVPDGVAGPQTAAALARAGGDLGLPIEDPATAPTIAALFTALLRACPKSFRGISSTCDRPTARSQACPMPGHRASSATKPEPIASRPEVSLARCGAVGTPQPRSEAPASSSVDRRCFSIDG